MKKLLLSAALLMGAMSMSAQILTEVEEGTYAITSTLEELQAAYDESHFSQLGTSGVNFEDGEVILDNEDLTIYSVKTSYFWITGGKLGDIQKDFPSYTGYVNLGSNLSDRDWTKTPPTVFFLTDCWQEWQSILKVVPKKNGTLSFGVYAGDNSRTIGIFNEATEADYADNYFGEFKGITDFRNDGENGTVKNAPAYVEATVEADRIYGLLGGGAKNLCLHQIKFIPSTGTGIENIESTEGEKTVEAYYTIDGARVNEPVKGIYIVKYSDGTAKKIVK